MSTLEMLSLAIESGLPLIHIRTDDIINVEDVLTHLAKEKVRPLQVPVEIPKVSELKIPEGRVFYTSVECKSLHKLYLYCVDNEKTIIFINTEKSVLQFDGGTLFPPKEMVLDFLKQLVDNPEHLLPAFGGLTLKDVGEIAQLTMTRDGSLTVDGVNSTRRAYSKLRGIQQVDTDLPYYVCPSYLETWMDQNTQFFLDNKHPSLTPRGLLFDGPPGTGKTLASKYIAHKFGVPLYRLDLGAMMGKYVGQSEESLNAALTQIDQVAPCVVILDEVEKVFQSSSDSGVTSRMLSQLLWWLQEHKSQVFVVMTANDVKKIPEELHREGRIDGTMKFMGIEVFADGFDFAKGAFDKVVEQVGVTLNGENYAVLTKRVKALFNDVEAVAQTKLTKLVYDYVRELSVEKVEQDEKAA